MASDKPDSVGKVNITVDLGKSARVPFSTILDWIIDGKYRLTHFDKDTKTLWISKGRQQ